MSFCPSCGKQTIAGSLFCPDCGARVPAEAQPVDVSQPMTVSTQYSMLPLPIDDQRSSPARRKRLVLAVIAVLAVLLIGATIESGVMGNVIGGPPAVNSASHPFTGSQLYDDYASNPSQAATSYNNKTVYVQDSLDFGVGRDINGQYFSSINQGTVILFWSTETNIGNLGAGSVILADCSVQGLTPQSGTLLLYLQNCDLVKIQSQAVATTTGPSVPPTNL